MTGAAPAGAGRRGRVELGRPSLRAWAARLGTAAEEAGALIALLGPLGAGKTTLVQAACEALGVVEPVLSPTYTLVHRYRGEAGAVWHVDLYRIESPAELPELGWDDLLDSGEPVFVEWAERAGPELPADRWEVRLGPGTAPDRRTVEVRARGAAPAPPSPRGGPATPASGPSGGETP